MRNIRRMSLLALMAVLLFAFSGCGDSDSEIQSNVITENDLFANPQIKATHQHTLVIHLEHPDGEGHDKDIGEKGVDEVPMYYPESVNHTFCWEDDTSDAGHSMELIDSSGNTVLIEHINGECANATIPAGHYTMRFTHGGQSEGTQAIFIRPVEDMSSRRGILNVSSVEDNIHTLITEGDCFGCDLSYANLYRANLEWAQLGYANLTRADLSHANLSNARMDFANLREAYLSSANLTDADLFYANLIGADLRAANLTRAYLYGVDLTDADVTQADLTDANLDCIIWIDGTACGVGATFSGGRCYGGSTKTCL